MKSPPSSILVRLPNWIGDVVMATPALKAIRRTQPRPRVTLLGKPHLRPLLDAAPFFDKWISLVGPRGEKPSPWAFGKQLRSGGFDTALLLPNSFSSALMVWRAGIPRRIGYSTNLRGVLLTHRLIAEREGLFRANPMVDYYLTLAQVLGAPCDDRKIELPSTAESSEKIAAYLWGFGVEDGEPLVALNPGAAFGSSKLWRPESFAEVGDHFGSLGARVLVLAGPGEAEIAECIVGKMRFGAINTSKHIIGLGELGALFRRCSLVITTDSGPRHIAVAAGTLVVVAMGPTHPRYTEVDSPRYRVVLERVPCWPCHLKRCPIDHRCMVGLRASTVIEEANKLLEQFGPRQLVN